MKQQKCTTEAKTLMKKFADKTISNCRRILHKKMHCHEYELLPPNHEDTKLKIEFPSKIEKNTLALIQI